jgi:integration host factor subunit alpha
MTMTKDELIGRTCEKAHLSKDDATNIIEATFEIIKASLERGEQVKIKNFGIFSVRAKKVRRGRNPQTGAEIVIPGHKSLTFKPSTLMKKTVATRSWIE